MVIKHIFELLKGKLWAVQYDAEKTHELNILQDQWTDVQWLLDFFDEHEEDLNSGFYEKYKVDDAIEITMDEADELFYALEEAENLDALFKPLNDRDYRIKNFQKQKAKGSERKTWLRIYAVRFNEGYVITGGAIKLTKTMQERAHTNMELKKLEIVRDALKLNNSEEKFIDLD